MKHWIACLPLFAALFLIGCDTSTILKSKSSPKKRTENTPDISASDREAVKQSSQTSPPSGTSKSGLNFRSFPKPFVLSPNPT